MPPHPKHFAGVGLRNLSPTYNDTATVNGVTSIVASFDGYQVFGPPAYLSNGNGLWQQMNFDASGRLSGISTNGTEGPLQSLTYGFDTEDRITAITNGIDAAQTQQYQYDGLSRLTQAALAGGNIASYAYDAAGNRVSQANTSPSSNGLHPRNDQQPTDSSQDG